MPCPCCPLIYCHPGSSEAVECSTDPRGSLRYSHIATRKAWRAGDFDATSEEDLRSRGDVRVVANGTRTGTSSTQRLSRYGQGMQRI